MENFTKSLETILTQRLWNPGCHPAEPPSEDDCSYVASGETPRRVKAPVTIEKEHSMRSMKWLGLILTAVFLLLCGCGGGPTSSTQPPSGLSYTTATADYTKGTAITPNSPTSTGGAVTSYSVSPALPAGLNLSTSTGIISGTPTAVTAAASYTVTASNSAGSTTASLSITVNVAAPAGLSYTTGTAVYTVGTPIPADSPTSTGGTVASYNVIPALPAGLTLGASTGDYQRDAHSRDRHGQLHGNGFQLGGQHHGHPDHHGKSRCPER